MKKAFAKFDWPLFLAALVILILGLVMIDSTAENFLPQQLISAFLGLVFFVIFALLDYRIFLKMKVLLFLGCVAFLFSPFLFGTLTRGAFRWLQVGHFTLQPSELVKPFLVLCLAAFWVEKEKPTFKRFFLGAIWVLVPAFLVFFQPDLGSSLIVIGFWLGIVLAAGLAWHWLVGGGLFFLLFLPLIWRFLKDYQQQRILSFLNPQHDPLGASYNLIQATVAVGSGQFWGRGLGRGTQSHLQFLPERHTDFIFASLAEELGLVGSFFLIACFAFLLWRILVVAKKSSDNFGFLICVGIFSFLLGHFFFNVAINLGLLPVTGIPLPLVSYGGSNLLATMIGLGIVENIARQRKTIKTIEIR